MRAARHPGTNPGVRPRVAFTQMIAPWRRASAMEQRLRRKTPRSAAVLPPLPLRRRRAAVVPSPPPARHGGDAAALRS